MSKPTSDSQNQQFKKRFKGKTNIIDKDGFIGVIAGKGEPIKRQGSIIKQKPISMLGHQSTKTVTSPINQNKKYGGQNSGAKFTLGQQGSLTPIQSQKPNPISSQISSPQYTASSPKRRPSQSIKYAPISNAGSIIISNIHSNNNSNNYMSPQKQFNGHSKKNHQSLDINHNYTPQISAQKTQQSRIDYDFDNVYFSEKKADAPKEPVKVYPMKRSNNNNFSGNYSNLVNQAPQVPVKRFGNNNNSNNNDRSSLNSNPPPHHYLRQKIEVTPHRKNGKSAGARRLSTDNNNNNNNNIGNSNNNKNEAAGGQKKKFGKKDSKSQLVEIGYRQISMSYHALPGEETPVNFLNPNFIQKHQADLKNLGYVAKNFKDATNRMNGGNNKRSNSYSNPYDAQKNARNYPKPQQYYGQDNLHQQARGPINVQDDQNQTSSTFSVKSNVSHYRLKQRVSPAIAILQEYQNKGKYYQLGGLGPYTIGTDNWKAGKARLKAINDFSNNLRTNNNLVYKSFKDQGMIGQVEIFKNGSYSMIQESPYQYFSQKGQYSNNISQYGNSFVGGGSQSNEYKYSIGCPPPKINQQQNSKIIGGRKSSIDNRNIRESEFRQFRDGQLNTHTIDYSDSKAKKHPDMISRNDISLGKSSSSKNFLNPDNRK